MAKRGGIGLLEMQRSSHATLRERPRPKRVAKFRPEFCVLTRSGRGANTEGGRGGSHHQPSTHTNEFHACRGPPPLSSPSFSSPSGRLPSPLSPSTSYSLFPNHDNVGVENCLEWRGGERKGRGERFLATRGSKKGRERTGYEVGGREGGGRKKWRREGGTIK